MNSVQYMQALRDVDANGADQNGAMVAAHLHPAYQQRLAGNASGVNIPASRFNTRNEAPPTSHPTPHTPVRRVFNSADVISQDQQQYFETNQDYTRNPTRFEKQNAKLKIGGAPLWQVHRDKVGPHLPAVDTSFTIPRTPQPPLSEPFRNPGPFDFGSAVRSSHPTAYTMPAEDLQRMMRPVEDTDPGLLTHPIADPTYLARQPVFNHAPENAETERLRTQRTSGAMRFW